MFAPAYYHGTIKKMVSIFGTLFNNIYIVRKDKDDRVVSEQRVALAYGPRQKFLTRLEEQPNLEGNKLAIKLPRMSFEIIGLVYDPTMKINRNQTISTQIDGDPMNRKSVRTFAPYRMQMQLSIMTKTQDDALQILEQILPNFQPEYSVTINDISGIDSKSDIPITITDVNLDDKYEGMPEDRRVIIYTLTFDIRVRFFGPVRTRAVIKSVDAKIGIDTTLVENLNVHVEPLDAAEDEPHEIIQLITFIEDSTTFEIAVQDGDGQYDIGEEVVGQVTGTAATVSAFDDDTGTLKLTLADGVFRVGEGLIGQDSGCNRTIASVKPIFE